jgi:hypothetical protein
MDRPRARAPAVAETVACVITHFCGAAGDVEFDEFKDWWYKQHFSDEWERERELQELFAEVDGDGSGFVDWGEFLSIIGNKIRVSRATVFDFAERTPVYLVRMALDNVRKDIRAIYGSTKRPLSVHDLAMQIEKSFHKVSTDLSDHSGNEVQ